MLKYCLVENSISKDGKCFIALSSSTKTVDLDKIIKDMVGEGTGLTRPQALAYFEKLIQLTRGYLEEGYYVKTPLFCYRSSISGKFDTRVDTFDENRHSIKITSTAGTRIREKIFIPLPLKVEISNSIPKILQFIDSVTDECNSVASAGETAMAQGVNLRFDKSDQAQGIFFVSVDDASIERRATNYAGIKPSAIYFKVPELEEGEYKVEIRTINGKNNDMVIGSLAETIFI